MQKARKRAQTIGEKRQPAHVRVFVFGIFPGRMHDDRRQKSERRIRNRHQNGRNLRLTEILPDKNEKLADVPQKSENGGRKKQKIERKFRLRFAMPHGHHKQKRVEHHADRKAEQIDERCRIERVHLWKLKHETLTGVNA